MATDGQPDAVPVGVEYDGAHFYVGGGLEPAKTQKFLNIAAGNDQVVLLWDDLVTTSPWTPRFLRVYGTADFVEHTGMFGAATYTPESSSPDAPSITKEARRRRASRWVPCGCTGPGRPG